MLSPSYYRPKLAKKAAEDALKSQKEGVYVLRLSSCDDSPGLVLSLKMQEQVVHIRFDTNQQHQDIQFQQHSFKRIEDLVLFLKKNSALLKVNSVPLQLSNPLSGHDDDVLLRVHYGQIGRAVAEQILMQGYQSVESLHATSKPSLKGVSLPKTHEYEHDDGAYLLFTEGSTLILLVKQSHSTKSLTIKTDAKLSLSAVKRITRLSVRRSLSLPSSLIRPPPPPSLNTMYQLEGQCEGFESLTDLLIYYHSHDLGQSGALKGFRLHNPVYCPDILLGNIKAISDSIVKSGDALDHGIHGDELDAFKSLLDLGMGEDFQELQECDFDNETSSETAREPANKSKNRYQNVLPFDFNRVRLSEERKSFLYTNDYINASRVRFENAHFPEYLAAQAPMQHTLEDFWAMIYENHLRHTTLSDDGARVEVILNLNAEGEKQEKYVTYFPTGPIGSKDEQSEYGIFQVKFVSQDETEHYTKRVFTLEIKNGAVHGYETAVSIQVIMFQILRWPDHGVPETPLRILSTLRDVHAVLGPGLKLKSITVHCSAGIGRAGTLIAIDYYRHLLTEQGDKGSADIRINVPELVLYLRNQRSGMVQTVNQYKFLYHALANIASMANMRTNSLHHQRTS